VQGELARIMMTRNGEYIQRHFEELSELVRKGDKEIITSDIL
jgi:hypothetical protein